MEEKFKGMPYPIVRGPKGLLPIISDLDTLKADMLQLLLTNPGERVMLPRFGTPLRRLFFEPNDTTLATQARAMIVRSLDLFEPRIIAQQINVTVGPQVDEDILSPSDDLSNKEHVLHIEILFFDPSDLNTVDALKLDVPITP